VDWDNAERFTLTRTSVIRNAPELSGVYGLCSPDKWLYIGQCANIRRAVLDYLSGQMPYVLQWQPKQFTFAVLPYRERLSKHKELVAHYQPVCNRKTQSLARCSG
jgi:hypothetical protein